MSLKAAWEWDKSFFLTSPPSLLGHTALLHLQLLNTQLRDPKRKGRLPAIYIPGFCLLFCFYFHNHILFTKVIFE